MDKELKHGVRYFTQVILFGCLVLLAMEGFAEVNKCNINGKTVYTDKACPKNTAESIDLSKASFSTTPSLAGSAPQNANSTNNNNRSAAFSNSGWLHDKSGYIEALKVSSKENRPIFIYGYTDWCGYCKKLHKNIFDDPSVNKLMSQFIRVKINPEHSASDKNLYSQWGGRGYPTLFIQASSDSSPSRTRAPFTKKNGKWELIKKDEFVAMLKSKLR